MEVYERETEVETDHTSDQISNMTYDEQLVVSP